MRDHGISRLLRPLLGVTAIGMIAAGLHVVASADDLGTGSNFPQRLYVNAGIGVTRLEPDSPTDALVVSDKVSTGAHLGLGFDFSRFLTAEFYVADLGAAEIEFLSAPVGDVDYLVYGASAIGYLMNSRSGFILGDRSTEGLFRREGLSLYGRVGLGHMQTDSVVSNIRDYPSHVAFGLGLEYGFSNGIALRTELMGFDTDAQYLTASVMKRFGRIPAVAAAPLVPDLVPPVVQEVVPATKPLVPDGPMMFKPIVPPYIYFAYNKSDLTTESLAKLDAFVDKLLDSDLDLQIDGHTDYIASEAYNIALSVRRAESVARYLAARGIGSERMKTYGFGESRPISNNSTAEGRALNRRVEIKIR